METLSDIVAEMRTRSREVKEAFGGRPDGVENMLDIWADRLEVAAKREKAEIEADAFAIGGIVEADRHTPGNAAAIREALVALRDAARNFCQQILNSKYNDIMDEYKCRERGFPALLDLTCAIPKANLALSEPPRQCDVGTPDGQGMRYKAFCRKRYTPDQLGGNCRKCPLKDRRGWSCQLAWAQTPYAEEEARCEREG